MVNIITGFPLILIIFAFIINIIFLILFFLTKKSDEKEIEIYYYIFWGIIFVCFPYFWISKGGVNSVLILLFLLIYIGFFLTTKKEYQSRILIFSILYIISLVLIDFWIPEIIVQYQSKNQRLADLIIGSVVYLSVSHYLMKTVSNQRDFEQRKLKLRNDQLDALVKERERLNFRLELSLKEIESMNISKNRFISIIAHDLRSPFQGLLGVSRLLNENYDNLNDSEKKHLLVKLNNLLESQYSFLEELLLWGRLQRTNVNLKVEKLNLKEILLKVVNHLKGILEKKKLKLNIHTSQDLEIYSDANLISTVYRNIISNAIKFSPLDGEIEILVDCQENYCVTKIKDYGLGIAEEDLQNLFRPDVKVNRKGTDGESGSGFGLMICHEIITKLDGKITIDSKEGYGTTVSILIPKAE
jgi:signal transduction histidine kinase